MFPFFYRSKLVVEDEVNIDRIVEKFQKSVKNPEIHEPYNVSFDNFHILKHKWLTKGSLSFIKEENTLYTQLELHFQTTSIVLIMASFAFIVFNLSDLWFALFSIVATWLFFGLLYCWSITVFRSIVKRSIRKS